jgi:hypothetical protein
MCVVSLYQFVSIRSLIRIIIMSQCVNVANGGLFGRGTSIEFLYQALSKYISDYEGELRNSIQGLSGKSSKDIDQGVLLNIQAKVQTWGTIVSTSTGVLRAVGDGLKSTTQNIR